MAASVDDRGSMLHAWLPLSPAREQACQQLRGLGVGTHCKHMGMHLGAPAYALYG